MKCSTETLYTALRALSYNAHKYVSPAGIAWMYQENTWMSSQGAVPTSLVKQAGSTTNDQNAPNKVFAVAM